MNLGLVCQNTHRKKEISRIPIRTKYALFLFLNLSLLLGGCSEHSNTNDEKTVSEIIDDLVSSIKEGAELNHEDRNKIYDLATYLNQKYKGEMESDEIIEVYSEN